MRIRHLSIRIPQRILHEPLQGPDRTTGLIVAGLIIGTAVITPVAWIWAHGGAAMAALSVVGTVLTAVGFRTTLRRIDR